jgi:hypothetical protein
MPATPEVIFGAISGGLEGLSANSRYLKGVITGTNSRQDVFINVRGFVVILRGVTIGTTGSPIDRASIAIPTGIVKWRLTRASYVVITAGGTLAGASAGVFTQAAGAGTTLVAAAALTPMTGINAAGDISTANVTTAVTDLNIFVRQTVNSGNAGTVDFFFECQDLT